MLTMPRMLALLALSVALVSAKPLQPHILFVMADDLGWSTVGWHCKATPSPAVKTPALDALVAEGASLDRHYTYWFCSPSRSAFLSGRLPIHVNQLNTPPCDWNEATGEGAGIGTNMTAIAEVLRDAGYATAQVGKWDAGMATPSHSPKGRGFQRSFGYFHHDGDQWSSKISNFTGRGLGRVAANRSDCKNFDTVDLWRTQATTGVDGPALGENGTGAWEDDLFAAEAVEIVRSHDSSKAPLFLYLAPHSPHTPLQAALRLLRMFQDVEPMQRRVYSAMVAGLDESVGNVTTAFKANGDMWANTLMVFSSDNGGPIYSAGHWKHDSNPCPIGGPEQPAGSQYAACFDQGGASNNWPLRGGKTSGFEGGVRVSAFISGGFFAKSPLAGQGKSIVGLISIADWWATFAAAAGVRNASDARAAKWKLPPVDSLNQLPYLMGKQKASARSELHIGDIMVADGEGGQVAKSSALLMFDEHGHGYKLLTGSFGNDVHTGPEYPNASTQFGPNFSTLHANCSSTGCLYDVLRDPEERHDLAVDPSSDQKRQLRMMLKRLAELHAGAWNPDRGACQPAACDVAWDRYGGYFGPFARLPPSVSSTAEGSDFSGPRNGRRP